MTMGSLDPYFPCHSCNNRNYNNFTTKLIIILLCISNYFFKYLKPNLGDLSLNRNKL